MFLLPTYPIFFQHIIGNRLFFLFGLSSINQLLSELLFLYYAWQVFSFMYEYSPALIAINTNMFATNYNVLFLILTVYQVQFRGLWESVGESMSYVDNKG